MSVNSGNLGRNERLVSLGAGTVLSALAFREGGPFIRLLSGIGAAAFLARALAGHCGMKSALTGQSSLKEGMTQQWQHMTTQMKHKADRAQDSGLSATAMAEKPVREQGEHTSDSPGWMSHQNGRVTGTGVTPGAGDSEAGTPARG